MNDISELFHRLRDLPALIQWAGYVGLTAIIFTETGLFFGFFLPGDSLLVTAGLIASGVLEAKGVSLDVYKLGFLLTAAAARCRSRHQLIRPGKMDRKITTRITISTWRSTPGM